MTVIRATLIAQMSLELIIGPMFSGKSSALISIIRKHEALGLICIAYKPNLDDRQGTDEYIYTHDGNKICARRTRYLMPQILTDYFEHARLIVIEEGQFFPDLYQFVSVVVETCNKNVIVAGLDGDRFRKPFGQMLDLIPLADRIIKLTSFCKLCADGTPALFSYSESSNTDTILVAGADLYMPLCRKHYLYESSKHSH